MRTITLPLAVLLSSLGLSACLPGMTNPTTQAVSNEVMAVCSTTLGPNVKSRVDNEWSKHATVESRQTIETVARVILSTPGVPNAEAQSMYKNYLTCATGVYLMRQQP